MKIEVDGNMGYRDLFKEENENVEERFDLMAERILEIRTENTVKPEFADFFQKEAAFILDTIDILKMDCKGALGTQTMEACVETNTRLYRDILPENYENSYTNPTYAVKKLGTEYGSLFSFLAAELRALISYAYEGRKMHMTILAELFVQIYNCMEDPYVEKEEIEQALYWFFHDYSEVFAEDKVCDMVNPEYDFFTNIVMQSDLSDLRYLYRYGEYISDCELQVAEFLNKLSEEQIQSMADTMTEGYRIGYEKIGKDIHKKDTVCVEYPIGFERVIRKVILNFEKSGLQCTIFRDAISSFSRGNGGKRGCYVKSVNKQYEFDHKADRHFYLDKAFVERRLESMKAAYEKYKKQARGHAGPAVMEIFGEPSFEPVFKPEAAAYTEKQNELNVYQMNQLGQMTNEYIPGDERSFTIISYPIPTIGEKFEEIFEETVKLNTLDYKLYEEMQQKLIDVLDSAEKVHITGKGENRTDLMVTIHPLKDRGKETAFENCVADVNIPVGEVFTSPVLQGTTGKLHVSQVYLNELQYLNLEVDFKDGMIADYSCSNFQTEEENKKFIYENVLMQHDTLPMGEFAIGTNTTAYKMARDFHIADKLPILIAEKTGPHFAVGDTCYSQSEDTKVYNPDGKEIIAKDNAVSILRKEDKSKAYFNCHTDITIPYDELDCITAIAGDGSTIDIIRDGKFVVEGTEELNRALGE